MGKRKGLWAASTAAAAILATTIAGVDAADSKRLLHKAAVEILLDVPEGRKLAIRPFFDHETPLPASVADKLYNDLFDAFFKASGGDHIFVDRINLLKIRNSREEFDEADLEQLLAAARADVEIICNPTPHSAGVQLACGATDLKTTTTLGRAQILVPIDAVSSGAQPYELALSQLAAALAPQLADLGSVDRIVIRDHNHGTQTDLGAWFGRQLAAQVENRIARTRANAQADYERQQVLNDVTQAPTGNRLSYAMTGTLYQLDGTTIQLLVTLSHQGKTRAKAGIKISMASLPKEIAPDRKQADRIYQAVGEAVLTGRLDREGALRAARNLARARVVAQALDLPGPAVEEIRTEADAAHVLTQTLSRGIPVEERFIDTQPGGAGDRVAVELRARVIPLGTAVHPDIRARLNKSTYRAMEPILIDLSSSATAFLGIYAWGADNRVVRLYPSPQLPSLAVEPETPLLLPQAGQGEIQSMPLPGPNNPEDHEAIIVIAGTKPMDFAGLAPLAGENLSQTLELAADGSGFFNALGGMDLSHMAVHILPYQVRR